MSLKPASRAVVCFLAFSLSFLLRLNSDVNGAEPLHGIAVKTTVEKAPTHPEDFLELKVKLTGSENCDAVFKLPFYVYEPFFPKAHEVPSTLPRETEIDSEQSALEGESLSEESASVRDFWPYSSRIALYLDQNNPPLLLKSLAENLKNEGLLTNFENRVKQLKVVATLLEIAVLETPNFQEEIDLDNDSKQCYVETWSLLWDLMERYEEEANSYKLEETDNLRTEVQRILFKSSRTPPTYNRIGAEVQGKEYSVGVFERLMRSRAALFGGNIGIYSRDKDGVYEKTDEKSRSEALSGFLFNAYHHYRAPIPGEAEQQKIAKIVVNNSQEKERYYKFALEDLAELINYVATHSDVRSFLEPAGGESGKQSQICEAVLSKAKFLHKYLMARKTLADEDETLEVVRTINRVRTSGGREQSADNLDELLKNETVKNLYDAAKGDDHIDGIWDAQIYLRYLFLLSFYEFGGVRVVGTVDSYNPLNYIGKEQDAKRVIDQFRDEDATNAEHGSAEQQEPIVEQPQSSLAENVADTERKSAKPREQAAARVWKNTLEKDWERFFKEFGTFACARRIGKLLPEKPEKLERVTFLEPDKDRELTKFLTVANDVPNNSTIQVVSNILEAGTNIFYYKSYERLLERYYQPKSVNTDKQFDFSLYYGLVNSLSDDFCRQMNVIFPGNSMFKEGEDDKPKENGTAGNSSNSPDNPQPEDEEGDKSEEDGTASNPSKNVDAITIDDVGSAAERARLTDDYSQLQSRASNLLSTQMMIASTRLNVYSDSDEAAWERETGTTNSFPRLKKFLSKPPVDSLQNMTIGDFPVLNLDSPPIYTLDRYVNFIDDVVEPYVGVLEDYTEKAHKIASSSYDVEIADLECAAAETAVQVSELALDIAQRTRDIALVQLRIADMKKELEVLTKEKDELELDRKLKVLELANNTSKSLDLQAKMLAKFIEDEIPNLNRLKKELDKMCEEFVKQAKKIKDAQRKAKKRGIIGAIKAVVNVVGIAASVFTGGASAAVMSYVNAAVNIAENVENLKFNDLGSAVKSLSYIGGEVGNVMSANGVKPPQFVKDAQDFIGKGLDEFKAIRQDLKVCYENFKEVGADKFDEIKGKIEENLKSVGAVDVLVQTNVLKSLDSLTDGEAFNAIVGLRDGAFKKAVSAFEEAGRKIGDYECFQLDKINVNGLQDVLNRLSRSGQALKSDISDLKNALKNALKNMPNELREEFLASIGKAGDKVSDKLRQYLKENVYVFFDDLKTLRNEYGKSLDKVKKSLEEEVKKSLEGEVKKSLEEILPSDLRKALTRDAFLIPLERVQTFGNELKELLGDGDAQIDRLLEEIQEGIFKNYTDRVAKDLDAKLEELFKNLLNDATKGLVDTLDELQTVINATQEASKSFEKIGIDVKKARDVARALYNMENVKAETLEAVKISLQKYREEIEVELKNGIKEFVDSQKAAFGDAVKPVLNNVKAIMGDLEDDLNSFISGGKISPKEFENFKNRLRDNSNIKELQPNAIKERVKGVYKQCYEELRNSLHEKIRNKLNEVSFEKITQDVRSNMAPSLETRITDLQTAINTLKEDLESGKGRLKDAYEQYETLAKNAEALLDDLPNVTKRFATNASGHCQTFVKSLPDVFIPSVGAESINLQYASGGAANETELTEVEKLTQGCQQIKGIVEDNFLERGIPLSQKDALNEDAVNEANGDKEANGGKEAIVGDKDAVNDAIGDVMNGENGDRMVDFLLDAIRSGAKMNVDEDGNAFLAVKTPASQGEEIREKAAWVEAAQNKVQKIITEYTNNMQRINETLKSAVNSAGNDANALEALSSDDGAVKTAQRAFESNYNSVKRELQIIQAQYEEAQAKVEIAEIDVEVGKKQLEIDNVAKQIADLEKQKAQMELEKCEKRIEQCEKELTHAQQMLEARESECEKASSDFEWFKTQLSEYGGVPKKKNGDIDIDKLEEMLKNNNVEFEGQATTSILPLFDPTPPDGGVLRVVIPDFLGVLKWARILELKVKSSPDVKDSKSNAANGPSEDGHDFWYFIREFCRIYNNNGGNSVLLKEMKKWSDDINGEYKRRGKDPHEKKLFYSEIASPTWPKGSYYETRYFIDLDAARYPAILDREAIVNAKEQLESILAENDVDSRVKKYFGNIDDSEIQEKKEKLEKEKALLDSILEIEPEDGPYLENVNADINAVRIMEDKLGAPVAKILICYRKDGGNARDDYRDGRFGKCLPDSTKSPTTAKFTPYVMENWIEIVKENVEKSVEIQGGLNCVVVDPEGNWIVCRDGEGKLIPEPVKSRDKFNDELLLSMFDNRPPIFELRELEGLWTIYVYDNTSKCVDNPFFYSGYGSDTEKDRARMARSQQWKVYFRYVKIPTH